MNIKTNDKKWLADMKRLEKNVIDIEKNVLVPAIEETIKVMKSIVPVDSGTLRDSIGYNKVTAGYEVKAEADYASDVEFGTINQQASPFFYSSIDATKRKLKDLSEKEIVKGVKR